MSAKLIMVQGTASHVGKSVITAAFCRIFTDMGFVVAPFKAQNMSNNSFVCPDGGEIGRAQAVQAMACGVPPSVEMNPILLKPEGDNLSQVVFMGKPLGHFRAREYFELRRSLQEKALDALRSLAERNEVVVVEGAGSPAEVNLKEHDFANWGVAKAFEMPIVLVGDIDKGGVFAHLVGTWELLEPDERKLIRAFLINKFRGDKSLLSSGLEFLEQRTGRPVLGVVPFRRDLDLPEEDSLPEDAPISSKLKDTAKSILIEVIRLPHLSNFTDFESFRNEPDVVVSYRSSSEPGPPPDAVVLPGSKSTADDLRFMIASGLDRYVRDRHASGVPVIGICGGFQMMGKTVRDPGRVESQIESIEGLALLRCETVLESTKTTALISARHVESGETVTGYEIHMGRTTGPDCANPVFRIIRRGRALVDDVDGASNGRVWGTYIHGVFDEPGFRTGFLNELRARKGLPTRETASAPPPLRSGDDEWKDHKISASGADPISTWAGIVRDNIDLPLLIQTVGL